MNKLSITIPNKPTFVQQKLVELSTNIGNSKSVFVCIKKDDEYFALDGSNRLFFLYSLDIEVEIVYIDYKNISKYMAVVNMHDSNIDFIIKKHKANSLKKYLSGSESFTKIENIFNGYYVEYNWNSVTLNDVYVKQIVEYENYKQMIKDYPIDIYKWQKKVKYLDEEIATSVDEEIN